MTAIVLSNLEQINLGFEDRKVLVLNKNYDAINLAPLKRAMNLLSSWYAPLTDKITGEILRPSEPKARVLASDNNLYTWQDWSKLRPTEADATAGTGQLVFKVPEIILLTRCDRNLHQQRVNFNRKTIYKRDGHRCQYCGCKPGDGELSIDHVLPRCQGGKTTWENCVLACVACNAQKEGRTPEQAFKNRKNWIGPSPMKLLSIPRKPQLGLFKSEKPVILQSWTDWISAQYWDAPLEHDMAS